LGEEFNVSLIASGEHDSLVASASGKAEMNEIKAAKIVEINYIEWSVKVIFGVLVILVLIVVIYIFCVFFTSDK